MIEYVIANKPKNIGDINALKKTYIDNQQSYKRGLLDRHFYRLNANGDKMERKWMVFSETSKCVYCYPCKLFSTSPSSLITGFNNWKNVARVLVQHEKSNSHVTSMCTLYTRTSSSNRVDTQFVKEQIKKQNYWKEILKRIVSTVKLLSSLGLPFRGHDESSNSIHKGNFYTCLQYLSEYDITIKNHLEKYGHKGSGNVSYLSHTIYDEFVELLGEIVSERIVEEINSAKYFSLIVDSTPDISHQDQLTFIVRYVTPDYQIKERFLGFIPIEEHSAEYLQRKVLSMLSDLNLNVKLCRGQSYDNAANMSGKYSGLQTRIKELSPTAVYIPCTAHSLNLVGNSAAECCSCSTQYFMFVEKIFTFFSSSNHRWALLSKELGNCQCPFTLKKLSTTRWSARADAVKALKCGYSGIKNALSIISASTSEKKVTVVEANSLLKKMKKFETVLMTVAWNTIMQRMNQTSKSLQAINCTVLRGAKLLLALKAFIGEYREKFDDIETC